MDLEDFCNKRPYLYHLTDKNNAKIILEESQILSTKQLAMLCLTSNDAETFLSSKREGHKTLSHGDKSFKIRDQDPILMKVLAKSLTQGWTVEQFLYTLNERVFLWPTESRLQRHFKRYKNEQPTILRIKSVDVLNPNNIAQFSRLNSGATRCHPKYRPGAPTRGEGTFVPIENFQTGASDVAEVTFIDKCILPSKIWTGNTPQGPWKEI